MTSANRLPANLTGAFFEDAALAGANLTGDNLTGADFWTPPLPARP